MNRVINTNRMKYNYKNIRLLYNNNVFLMRYSTISNCKRLLNIKNKNIRYLSNNINNNNNNNSNNTNNKKRYEYNKQQQQSEHMKVAYYMGAIAVFIFGLSYASVPLYKVFCQMTGYGGTTQRADENKVVEPVPGAKVIKVDFVANTHSTMPWKFKPTQSEVRIVPGETALAFYTVTNPTDKAILGVATYNVFPPKAGLYFNKIQCFCFEEQRLGPHEEIDMPVFFFIDPEICNDPAMENTTSITLSYTFFKTGEEEMEKDGEVKIINRDAKTEAYTKALIERNKQNNVSTNNNIDLNEIQKDDKKNNQSIINYTFNIFKWN